MGVTNRVWDAHLTGTVHWDTTYPDATGQEYPGPGSFSVQASDFCIVRGEVIITGSEASPDTTFNPVSRWLLDGDLTDEEGLMDMVFSVGTEQYAVGPFAGLQAHNFNGSTRLFGDTSPAPAALRITGSIAMACWCRPTNTLGTFGSVMCEIAGLSGDSDTTKNFLGSIDFRDSSRRSRFVWEDSSAVAQNVHDTGQISADEWHHFIATRDDSGGPGATVGRIYIDGELVHEETTRNPAFGGSAAVVRMGADSNTLRQYTGRLFGVTVYGRALTQAEAMALYKKGIPPEDR